MANPPGWDQLKGPDRDAADALIKLFSSYGLSSLAGRIIDMVKQGFSSDTMSLMLEKTPEYQKRFAANAKRRSLNLPVLSPKEYIETERAYSAIMNNSGMPKGFYDTYTDYQKFLEMDIAPTELGERVKLWQTEALKDSEGLAAIRKITGLGASDYAAYLMDPARATPLLTKTAQAVSFAAAAGRHGFDVSKTLATQYGNRDVSASDAEQGFQAIEEVQADTDRLAKMYGLGGYDVEDAAAEVFAGDADAAKVRKKAASAEKATFAGSSKGNTGKSQRGSNY
jgi:hypothetical protein